MQTTLLDFISHLLGKGEISVTKDLSPFTDMDQLEAMNALRQAHEIDAVDLPFKAPSFNEEAALWAATYLYRAVQCSLLRDLDEDKVKELLQAFEGGKTASHIYSADLILRYIPDLWNLAKGLAPDDILVVLLRETAKEWPFSSIGIESVEDLELTTILENPCLRITYVDRLIEAKDKERLKDERLIPIIKEILGEHTAILAPQIKDIILEEK